MNSLVSIIVPIYNTRHYLHRCIDSIINQSYHKWELILVDDGSTDQSGKICDEFADNDCRIKVIHKMNGGVSSARNHGLEIASGDWVTFIDSDDFVGADYIGEMIRHADSNIIIADSHADMEYEYNNESGIRNYLRKFVHSHNIAWGKLYDGNIIRTHSLRFDESIRFGEDTLFYLSFLLHCKAIAVIPRCQYHYCSVGGMTSERYNLSVDEIHRIGDKLMDSYDVLDRKYGMTINTDYDKMQLVSMYPLETILSDGDDEYYELYRSYFPHALKTDLYSDRFCSPMVRTITYSKILYVNGSRNKGRSLIASAYNIYKESFYMVRYRYKIHTLIGWLIGHKCLFILHLVLSCYALGKQCTNSEREFLKTN